MKIDSHVHISIFEKNAENLEEAFALLSKNMEKKVVDFSIVIPDNIENSPDVADLDKAMSLIKGNKKFFLLGSPQITQRGASEIGKYNKLCQDLDVPVLFHTGENSRDSECAKWNDPKYIVKVAEDYPKLKIIIAHYFWPKMDYCYETTKGISNIYFDIAAMADDEVVEKSGGIEKVKNVLRKTINDGDNKVILGSDWPMCKMESHVGLIKSLGLGKDIEDKIFYGNAIGLYKLTI